MNTATVAHTSTPLQVVKNFNEYQQQVQLYTNTAWQIIYTALWNTAQFSEEEEEVAKKYISNFLETTPAIHLNFNTLIQRVILARQYIISHDINFTMLPSTWFNPQNKKGFVGTQSWLQAINKTRLSLPHYKQPLKVFAQAITETTFQTNPKTFHYWRNYFIDRNANALLNLYLSVIANINNIK
jgi:hypothetical protein